MLVAKLPDDENERLESLRQLQLLDSPIEERFERITRLACATLNVPIAAFSLIDKSRQWFKSAQGFNAHETSREASFCSHTILDDEIMLVPDTTKDERFADNPFVTGDMNINFYAGCPVRAPDGKKVGSLCAIDTRPRDMSPNEMQTLRDLAMLIETELRAVMLSKAQTQLLEELDTAQLLALVDPLTRLWNRRGIFELLNRRWREASRDGSVIVVVMADIDYFKKINDKYGHAGGDIVLQSVSRRLLAALREEDAIGRIGGEEFLLILTGCQAAELKRIVERIRIAVAKSPVIIPEAEINVTLSFGASAIIPEPSMSMETFISFADKALYAAKQQGRNRVEVTE